MHTITDANFDDAVSELELSVSLTEQRMAELTSQGASPQEIEDRLAPMIDHAVSLYQGIMHYATTSEFALRGAA